MFGIKTEPVFILHFICFIVIPAVVIVGLKMLDRAKKIRKKSFENYLARKRKSGFCVGIGSRVEITAYDKKRKQPKWLVGEKGVVVGTARTSYGTIRYYVKLRCKNICSVDPINLKEVDYA